jgi:hypothetical protein
MSVIMVGFYQILVGGWAGQVSWITKLKNQPLWFGMLISHVNLTNSGFSAVSHYCQRKAYEPNYC